MGDIQFVFEKPQKPARTSKKRSRLITSCDACRAKKIKCRLTGPGEDKCEACESSGSACVFDERNRIRRQRGIATFTVAPTRHGTKGNTRTVNASSVPVIVAGIHEDPSPSTSSSQDSRVLQKKSSCRHAPYPIPEEPNIRQSNSCSGSIATECILDEYSLFDPQRQDYPHPKLLPHLVELFLLFTGSTFPFFHPTEIIRSSREGTLSPLLANCISAYAARFSDTIRHLPGLRHLSGEPFLDTAKCLLSDEHSNSLDRLHATILIAWIESGSGRPKSLLTYSQMASCQAAELRLYSEETILQIPCEETRDRCRLTFWAVVWLDIIACSVNGKCCLLRLDECSTGMPRPGIETYGTLSRVLLYQVFRGVMSLMVSLNLCSNHGKPSAPSASRDMGLREIQEAATSLKERLPASIAFSRDNLSTSAIFRESFPFYLIHVLMHCFLVVTHCPSLFWTSQPPKSITEAPRLDVAWSSATAIIDILTLMQKERYLFVGGASSAFMPLSIARGALSLAQADIKSVINRMNMTVEEFRLANGFYLTRCSEMLEEVSRYWAGPGHIEISSEAVALLKPHTASQDSKTLQYLIASRPTHASDTFSPLSNNSSRYPEGPQESEDGILQSEDRRYHQDSSIVANS